MSATATILGKELRGYFCSPIAYVVGAVYLMVNGFFFGSQLAMRELSVAALFQSVSVLLLFLTPAVAMRSFSEEFRTGTIETLMTDPVREVAIVVGKFTAAVVFVVLLLVPLAGFCVVLHRLGLERGGLDLAAVAAGFVGVALMAAACLAIGVLVSTLTRNQIVAAVSTCIALLLLYLAHRVSPVFGAHSPSLGGALDYVSMAGHLHRFHRGEVALEDVFYFASVIVAALTLAVVSLDARRWR